jgi:serine protease
MRITNAQRIVCVVALAVTATLLSTYNLSFADESHAKAGARRNFTNRESPSESELVERLIVTPHPNPASKSNAQRGKKTPGCLNATSSVNLAAERKLGDGSHLLRLDRLMTVSEARALAAQLQQCGEVVAAEPDLMMHTQGVAPNDPGYASGVGQWNYFAPSSSNQGGANVPGAWDITLGSGNVEVAVIDTGYRSHIDLQQMLPGYDFISSTTVANDGNGRDADASDPGDYSAAGDCGSGIAATRSSWHGTHVMGIIAALMNNGLYGTGIAPDVRILPLRALGRCGGYTSDIVDAMRWAVGIDIPGVPHNTTPARVINLSLGSTGPCSTAFQSAVNAVNAAGAIVVVASGNGGSSVVNQPANCNGVIAVTANAIDGDSAEYANIGTQIMISAPGGGCGTQSTSCIPGYTADGPAVYSLGNSGTSTPLADSAALKYGTSMAVPHVVGTIALLLSMNPALTRSEIISLLRSTARPFPDSSACKLSENLGLCGAGLLDTRAALAAMPGASPNHVPVLTPMPDQQVSFGGTLRVQLLATDADGDAITYHIDAMPAGASLSSAGLLSWPNASPVGSRSLSWTARDATGSSLPGQFRITVTDNDSTAFAPVTGVAGSNGGSGGGGSMGGDLMLAAGGIAAVMRRWRRR